ncbi:uncharacterized protein LOC143861100 [Tasmannia lanceolata]|uniref:uncharacterized protein LOC143861100 n=1 Tax=Tasmannia lanceolata TaxID=3420 RepID=UPI00406303A7
MKNGASTFLKRVISVVGSLVKAKSVAVKSKTSAMKARLIIFGLLRSKKLLLPAISQKIHELLGQDKQEGDPNNAIVVYNALVNEAEPNSYCMELVAVDDNLDDDDDRYPDLTHSLFDELEFDNGSESVIDLVKHNRERVGDTSEFSLEDEIDHVADVFIRRFKRQMQMQKQESFKRYQDMLDRSA